jgi:hypothetical protein
VFIYKTHFGKMMKIPFINERSDKRCEFVSERRWRKLSLKRLPCFTEIKDEFIIFSSCECVRYRLNLKNCNYDKLQSRTYTHTFKKGDYGCIYCFHLIIFWIYCWLRLIINVCGYRKKTVYVWEKVNYVVSMQFFWESGVKWNEENIFWVLIEFLKQKFLSGEYLRKLWICT